MDATPENCISRGHSVAKGMLVLLSLLLLLTGFVVLGQFASRPLPQGGFPANPIPPAAAGVILLMCGSSASLWYVCVRARPAWNAGIILTESAIVVGGLVPIQGVATLVWTPARGDFGGLVNFAVLVLVVIVPLVVTLIASAATYCLVLTRPEPQEPVARWVKRLTISLAWLFLAAGTLVGFGVGMSSPARLAAQTKHLQAGNASVKELADALQSRDISIRFWAVQELRSKGPLAKSAVPALAQALNDKQMISWPAADALAKIGPDAAPAIPALVAAIEREQGKGKTSETGGEGPSTFSWLAGEALAGIGPASIDALVTLLAHEDRFVRMTAAHAVGKLGPQAQNAAPALHQALNDDDETVRRYARVALNRIGAGLPSAQRPPDFQVAANEAASKVQEIPLGAWTQLATYTADPRTRPPGTVCVTFDDGYRWLIAESVLRREQRVEGDRKIETAVTAKRRYEHVLGTQEVRIIDSQ
jgi:hypothetical protein